VLFGEHNPSGKLTMTFPQHVGALPVFYSRLRHQHGENYADLPEDTAYDFGFGLSYTRYEYSRLRVATPSLSAGTPLRLEVDVTNAGARAGVEITQVYVRDVVTSVTWPSRLLAAFERVALEPSETKTLAFEIPFERLALIDAYDRRVVEPGDFEVMVGGSSRLGELLVAPFVVQGELAPLSRIPGVLGD
jgi:beta-glucosidase